MPSDDDAITHERNRCIAVVRAYLQFDSQRAVSWHEVQDCITAMMRDEWPTLPRSANNEPPYLRETVTHTIRRYNPAFGNGRLCKCGHEYDRHFDSHDDNDDAGCKYCGCGTFVESRIRPTPPPAGKSRRRT